MVRIILFILLFSNPIFANNWVTENDQNTYVDTTSYKYILDNKSAYITFKEINDAKYKLENINNQKVNYKVSVLEYSCAQKIVCVLSEKMYNANDEIISSKSYGNEKKCEKILEDTMSEIYYFKYCKPYFMGTSI